MILVDTSVWINHLRSSDSQLTSLLLNAAVLVHPFVIGELACGNLRNRRQILGLLADMPTSLIASDREVLHYIEENDLMGCGIGYIDAHLLASVSLSAPACLWTADRKLREVATRLNLAHLD